VDASTTTILDNSVISSDETVNENDQLRGTQLIPPKIQNILNRELEPGEQVIYTKVPRVDCCAATLGALLLGISFCRYCLSCLSFPSLTVQMIHGPS
jgi:hypothetical protein